MVNPTISATNSLAKNSRIIIANHAGARLRVASTTTTTVVVDSVDELTGTALYDTANPGQLVILSSAAGTGNHGMTANITDITGTTLTVDVDFNTGGELADGDVICVLPPVAFELFPNGGHTLNETVNNDETMGLTETFITHNTPMDVRVGGDIPFFQTIDSDGFARLIMAGVGAYKQSSGHFYRPLEADDGTFSEADELTVYSQDGNGTLRRAWHGLFATTLNLEFPQGGIATGSLSLTGNGYVREIGGTGKEFTSGANNWIVDTLDCDTGTRHTFRGVFMELGGSFGDDLTDARQATVQDISVTIERGAQEDQILGDEFIVKPEEIQHTITITGTRLLSDDEFQERNAGAATDATTGQKQETRVLIKAVSSADATKTLSIDVPRSIFTSQVVNRQRGRFTESFTVQGLATLDSDGCIDSATPLYEIELQNGSTDDLLTTVPS